MNYNVTEYEWGEIYNIKISPFVHELVRRLHSEYPNREWSCICRTEKEWDGSYIITDAIFTEQDNTWSNTIITKKWKEDMLQKIFEINPADPPFSEFNCWLHSHHSMSCFWSWIDTQQMADHNINWGLTHFISIVTAFKKQKWVIQPEYLGRINFYEPLDFAIKPNVEVVKLDSIIELEEGENKRIDDEVENYRIQLESKIEITSTIVNKAMPSSNWDIIKLMIAEQFKDKLEKYKNTLEQNSKLELAWTELSEMRGKIEEKVSELKDAIKPAVITYGWKWGWLWWIFTGTKEPIDEVIDEIDTVEDYITEKLNLEIARDAEWAYYTDDWVKIHFS